MKNFAKNKTYEFLKILYFVRFLGDALTYTFLYVFLAYRGLSSDQIGLIAAIAPLAAFVGSVVLGKLAKNININRKLMIILGFVEMIVALLFMIYPLEPFVFYIILIMISSMLNGPYYSLLDGYSGSYITKKGKQYSSMRIMGTLAYIIGPILAGLLVNSFEIGYVLSFLGSAVFLSISAVLAIFLPVEKLEIDSTTPAEDQKRIELKKYPELITYLVFNFFVISFASTSDNFYGIYFTNTIELSTLTYGFFIASAVAMEAIVFVFIIYRKNMFRNPTFAYIFVGFFAMMRPLGVALDLSPALLFAVGILRGIAWGYYLVYNVKYLSRVIPLKYLTSALFMVAIVSTLGRIISSLIIGKALEFYTYPQVFSIVSLFIFLGFMLSAALAQWNKKRRGTKSR